MKNVTDGDGVVFMSTEIIIDGFDGDAEALVDEAFDDVMAGDVVDSGRLFALEGFVCGEVGVYGAMAAVDDGVDLEVLEYGR